MRARLKIPKISGKLKRSGGGAKLILFVGDEGAILVHAQGNALLKRLFAANAEPPNVRTFVELCQTHPKVPIYLLVDMIDQSYVRHDFPPVSSMSVHKLIKRRLDRDFGKEDIKGALRLGRDTEGRKDWHYLLIALAQSKQLNQWLEFISELPNRLKGVYLSPVEAQETLGRLSKAIHAPRDENPPAWQLLVSHNKVGGFRQVVLKDGKLLFTRLAQPVGETLPEVIAGNIEQEVLNTVEYLKRLSLQDQSALGLYLIVSQDIKNVIEPGKFKTGVVEILTPHEAAQALELEQAAQPGDHFGDVVLATAFAAASKQRLRLSTPELDRTDLLHNARLAVRGGAVAIGVGMAGYSAVTFYDMFVLSSAMEQLGEDRILAEQNLASVKEQAKLLPADIDQITDAVSIYEDFSQQEYPPNQFIRELQTVLEEGIRIKNFQWSNVPSSPNAEGTQPQIEIIMDVEFTRNTGNRDAFKTYSRKFIDTLRTKFSYFNMDEPVIPGEVADTESVVIDFDKNVRVNADEFVRGKPIIINIKMVGPKPGTSFPEPPGAAG